MHSHLEGLFDVSRRALSRALAAGRASGMPQAAVDATAGNGHDTLFLAEGVGEGGRVFAFDVQNAAIEATRTRLAGAGLAGRAVLACAGHETLATAVPEEWRGRVRAATFNLGYLPGSDKTVVTAGATTIMALAALLPMTAPGGVISVHCYQGHPGGEAEGRDVALWFEALPWAEWRVAAYGFANKRHNRETVFLAEKIG